MRRDAALLCGDLAADTYVRFDRKQPDEQSVAAHE